MSLPQLNRRLTAAEYLELERAAEFKSEFIGGEMIAIAGAEPPHNRIAGNIFAELHAQLKGKTCEPFGSDQRVKADPAGAYTYPDVSVACPPVFGEMMLLNPTVLVEVLSDSTAFRDRVEKWDAYRQIAALQEYVLAHQSRPQIKLLVRHEDGWLLQYVTGLDANLTLPSLGITVPMADIYTRVDFAPVK